MPIQRRQLDPKTVELSNTAPGPTTGPPLQNPGPPTPLPSPASGAVPDPNKLERMERELLARQMMDEYMQRSTPPPEFFDPLKELRLQQMKATMPGGR